MLKKLLLSFLTYFTFVAYSQCLVPTGMNSTNITVTSVVLSWTSNSTTTSSFDIEIVVSGTAPTGVPTHSNVTAPFVLTGLTPSTNYCFFVRSVCGNNLSNWTTNATGTGSCFTTQNAPPVCGGIFTDNGGSNGNYLPSSDVTTTICPNNPGEVVSVHFTTFQTEANWDALYIFNGNSITSTLIASGNGAASVPGGLAGGYWGSQLTGQTIVSTSPNGCLTFRFRSDTNIQQSGWVANVICTTTSCNAPTNVNTETLTMNAASIVWNSTNASNWQILLLNVNDPDPTATTNGIPATFPHSFSGLTPNTTYKVFVKSICTNTLVSEWSQAYTFTTPAISLGNPIQLNQCNNPCFNLAQNTPMVLGNLNPSLYQVSYHGNLGDAQQNTNAIPNPQNHCFINTAAFVQVVFYVRVQEIQNPTVFAIKEFSISHNAFSSNPVTQQACDDNQDGLSCFNVENLMSAVLQNNPNQTFTVSFFNTNADAVSGNNPITGNYCTTTPNSQTLFYKLTNTQFNCNIINTITLNTINCSTICPIVSNITVTGVSTNGGVINWISNTTATSYIVQVVAAGTTFNPNFTQNMVQNNVFTAANLSCNTNYTVYIRPICANNVIGNWSLPITFTTSNCPSGISVNPGYQLNQLINDVLINTNCATVSNISSQGNAGIGYFNANNSGFIFDEGMIIRSGLVQHTAGLYTGQNVSTIGSNQTDAELQQLTNQMGQSGQVKDASFVKFDLVPTSNFMSFVFMFTSNEYGFYQCSFADTFAFILTNNVTGEKQNLAVVPGTNTPISVTTIRNQAHNSNCPSMNQNFFGQYNVNNPNAKLNMTGQTVPMTAFANVVPGQSYSLKLVVGDYQDTAFDSAVLIKGGSMVFGNQCADNLQLVPFVDTNTNGVKETGEPLFINGNFSYVVNNNGVVVNNNSNAGNTFIYPSNIANTYDIQYQIDPTYAPFYSSNTTYNDVSILANSGTNIFYFPILNTNPYNDVAVSIIGIGAPPRPGFTYNNKIIYTNYGLTPASGTLTFNKANAVSILSATPAGFTPTTTGFNFNYSNLMPFETRQMFVTMQVPVIPTVALGELLTNNASITSLSADIDPTNNQSSLTQEIVGSWDPNNIIETHGEKILFSSFNANEYLYYTINFQNLGTASAIRVVVDNLLNSNLLDVNTFEMINSSHNYIVETTGNLLKWTFQDINLASHLASIPDSQGYIYYKIKPKPGFTVGTIIPNAADIYFDFNPAVITETFNTEFVTTLSNDNFNSNTVSVYPNPANESLTIKSLGTIKNISITDMQGKIVYENDFKEGNLQTINVSPLAKGIYTISIAIDDNVVHQKLILK